MLCTARLFTFRISPCRLLHLVPPPISRYSAYTLSSINSVCDKLQDQHLALTLPMFLQQPFFHKDVSIAIGRSVSEEAQVGGLSW